MQNFSELIDSGAYISRTRRKVPHSHSGDIVIYRGPMQIPAHVAEALREDPALCRATGKGTHTVSRYTDADGTVYVFRCPIPSSRNMRGEIVRTPIGDRIRVHCWHPAARSAGFLAPCIIALASAKEKQHAKVPTD